MFSIQSGGTVWLHREAGVKSPKVPTGTYGVACTMQGEFYLYPKDDMVVPSITYGDTDDKSDRIIKTFLSRSGKNTGILLEGTKGSGKTLQAKLLSRACADIDIPTIIIGSSFKGEGFINFLSSIKQRIMVMIDEFDKQYPEREDQDALLTLLDGIGGYDNLYVLTKNDGYVSEFLRNRPSRIFYNFSYKKLPRATMMDFLDKNLENKVFVKDFETMYELSSDLNFDVVQALTEELNRYPTESFASTLSIMGITVNESNVRIPKEVKHLIIDGVDYKNAIYHEDLDSMSASNLFSGRKYEIILDPHKTKGIPEIKDFLIVGEWVEEEEMFDDHTRIILGYDENLIKSMGASGYHFAGERNGHRIDVLIEPKEQKSFTSYAFGY